MIRQNIKVSKKPWTSVEEYNESGMYGTFNDDEKKPYVMLEARTRQNLISIVNSKILLFHNGTIAKDYSDGDVALEVIGCGAIDNPCPTTQFLNSDGILKPNPNWLNPEGYDAGAFLPEFSQEQLKLAQITFIEAQKMGWRNHYDVKQQVNIQNGGGIVNSQSAYQYADDFDALPMQTKQHLRAMMLDQLLNNPDLKIQLDPEVYVKYEELYDSIIKLKDDYGNGWATQEEFNQGIAKAFNDGELDAQFKTIVNGKRLQTRDGEIVFHSKTTPTTNYNLVDNSKLINLVKEYQGELPEDLAKDSIYLEKETITPVSAMFADLTTPTTDVDISKQGDMLWIRTTNSANENTFTIAIDPVSGVLDFDGLKFEQFGVDKIQYGVSPASYEEVLDDGTGEIVKTSNGIAKHSIENLEVAETTRTTDLLVDGGITLDGVRETTWPTTDLSNYYDKTETDTFLNGKANESGNVNTSNLDSEGSNYFANKVIYGWDDTGKIGTNSTYENATSTEKFKLQHIDAGIPIVEFETDNAGNNATGNFFNTKLSVLTDETNGLSPVNVQYFNDNKGSEGWTTFYESANPITQNNSANGTTEAFAWTGDESQLDRFSQIDTDGFFVDIPEGALTVWPNVADVKKEIEIQLVGDFNTFLTSTGETFISNALQRKRITLSVDANEPSYEDIVLVVQIGDRRTGDNVLIPKKARHYHIRIKVQNEGGKYIVSLQEQVRYKEFTYNQNGSGGTTNEGFVLISDGDVRVRKVRYE